MSCGQVSGARAGWHKKNEYRASHLRELLPTINFANRCQKFTNSKIRVAENLDLFPFVCHHPGGTSLPSKFTRASSRLLLSPEVEFAAHMHASQTNPFSKLSQVGEGITCDSNLLGFSLNLTFDAMAPSKHWVRCQVK